MKTNKQIASIVASVTCDLFPNWALVFIPGIVRQRPPFIRIEGTGPCAVTGKELEWTGRKWQLSYHMTDTEIVCTAYKAWEAALQHELREFFKYKNVQVFDPHRSIEALVGLDGRRDVR